VARLRAAGKPALTAATPEALLSVLLAELRTGDVVVTMSSGAFGGFPRKLLDALRSR
jgi:UDP-N-acetylmuramate-alanine ligase